MKSERTQYKVDIFGVNYILVSDESAELVMQTTRLVDSLMRDISVKNTEITTEKIAVLVAVQLASQLVSLKNEKDKSTIKEANLIDRVEHALSTYAQ